MFRASIVTLSRTFRSNVNTPAYHAQRAVVAATTEAAKCPYQTRDGYLPETCCRQPKECAYVPNGWIDGNKMIKIFKDFEAIRPQRWRNSLGVLHRAGDLPAIVHPDGTNEYWVHGKRHRGNDKPAIEWSDGTKEWYFAGVRHRNGGRPAFVNPNTRWVEHWIRGTFVKGSCNGVEIVDETDIFGL